MVPRFTPAHRGGSGTPLVCLHGFMDTWRIWELVLPTVERNHDVLAITLPGHAGGPPLARPASLGALVDAVEHALDQANLELAHIVGNSLGGYIAFQLAMRGRAASVVAFAPAGGWEPQDRSWMDLLNVQRELQAYIRTVAPQAEQLLATREGRRRATALTAANFEHIPTSLLVHQMLGIAACEAAGPLVESVLRDGWPLDASKVTCPVRIVWGTADELLTLPTAGARFRAELPQAEWVLLDGVAHSPQLDVPLEAAQLILGFTSS